MNVAFDGALWMLTVARVWRYTSRVVADLMNHGRSVGVDPAVWSTATWWIPMLVPPTLTKGRHPRGIVRSGIALDAIPFLANMLAGQHANQRVHLVGVHLVGQ